jgi:large conductance mechanosensitive channel
MLKYGSFLQTVFDFLIIAIVIFIMIRGINKLKKPPVPAADAPPPPPPRQEVLLEQIRDALVKR